MFRWLLVVETFLFGLLSGEKVGAAVAVASTQENDRPMDRAALQVLADVAAQRHGVPAGLFKGLIEHESSWNPRAFRNEPRIRDASRGLAQLLYRTALDLGYSGTPDGLYDPAVNLDLGARYLRRLRDRFRSWEAALAAYNGGPRAAQPVTAAVDTVLARDQVTGVPTSTFTAQPGQFRNQPYVDAVMKAASRYSATGVVALGGLLAWWLWRNA